MDNEDIEHWVHAFKNALLDYPVSISHRDMHWRYEVVVELNLNTAIVIAHRYLAHRAFTVDDCLHLDAHIAHGGSTACAYPHILNLLQPTQWYSVSFISFSSSLT
jgi:hypothetical protein